MKLAIQYDKINLNYDDCIYKPNCMIQGEEMEEDGITLFLSDCGIEYEPISNIQIDENFVYLKDADKGDNFEIDDNTIVKTMVLSKKDLKSELLNGWVNIKKYVASPDLDKYASLLVDGHPLVVSNNMVLIEYAFPKIIEKVNCKKNQAGMQAILEEIFHKKLFVYGISRNESVRLQRLYMDLLAVSKLPKQADINLEFIGGNK